MRLKLVAAALLAGSVFSAPGHAAINIASHVGDPGYIVGNVNYSPTSYGLNAYIGRSSLTGTDTVSGDAVDFLTYCVDIFTVISTPGTFDIISLPTFLADATKRDRLLTLVSTGDPLIGQAATLAEQKDISSALQLAVWEIMFEDTATYSLSGGTFKSFGVETANARALADSYLGSVTSSAWSAAPGMELRVLYSATNQSQIYLSPTPEPASWAMMISGFGLIGAAMRRRLRGAAALA